MANQTLQLAAPANTGGPLVDLTELTVSGKTVERQNVCLADPAGAALIQNIIATALGGTALASSVGLTQTFSLTATSPSSATTQAGTPVTGLGAYHSLLIFATLQGATGGTLDVYLQVSPDGGTTWIDYAHFAQISAAASAVSKVFAVSKHGHQLTVTTVGTGTTPALAAGTVVGGDFGDRMRVVFVAGSGTSAGASQVILITATT